ncbi:helix-turn-helix transcriptional regulator [Marinirhabdus gelatinilytica]|uniref:Helix-turn-helix protein n=1 Tax=Marinirhabdus gelatinilytica TaxID=1703343 RepID=A0A370QF32_9FLAO|nr:helix-turn-helix transcriptional regulator [Marinirhabdus gelatinilytica]RDK86975.1 helix-turn-helix protein [Marinirhabdus gelatinilytica]
MEINKDIELKKLGEKIKAVRKRLCLTQFDLGVRIDKDQQSISRLEAGEINPSYIYLMEICKGLEVELKDIL